MSSSPSSHCMKEEFCWCEPGIETVFHETLGCRYLRFTLEMWQSSILKNKIELLQGKQDKRGMKAFLVLIIKIGLGFYNF